MADNKSRAPEAPENVPSVAGTESNDSVGEARPETSDQVTAVKPPRTPQFGPGSKVHWDDDKLDPNKRKHVGIDPDGKHNAKLVSGGDPDAKRD